MSDETTALPPEPEPTPEPTPEPMPEQPEQLPYDEPERRTGSHPVNVGQLVMGLVFLCIVGAWALVQSDTVSGDDIHWLLPLPWVIGGAIGLAAAAISSVRRHGVGRS